MARVWEGGREGGGFGLPKCWKQTQCSRLSLYYVMDACPAEEAGKEAKRIHS
jgi:hypothetical protein